MKKIRMIALPIMLASFFFVFSEKNFAKAEMNQCLPPDASCGADYSCCSHICCGLYDTRPDCQFAGTPNTCN